MVARSLRRAAGPAPDAADLHETALAYLARYSATEASLRRVLQRRVERWARIAADAVDVDAVAGRVNAARQAVGEVVMQLVAAGAVNDAAFAESRARGLVRAGRSRRAAAAHLMAKGIDPELAHAALPDDDETELAAALVLARRRRIGPFRVGPVPDAAGHQREMAVLARAGFPQSVARRALATDPNRAQTLVDRLRR